MRSPDKLETFILNLYEQTVWHELKSFKYHAMIRHISVFEFNIPTIIYMD